MKSRSVFKFFVVSVFILCLAIFTLRFDPEVRDLEGGVYNNVLSSIVEDGDLNIINQVSKEQSLIATKTYNYSNLHDNGVSSLWLPFYLYAKIVNEVGASKGYYINSNYRVSMVLANIFYTFVLLILLCKFSEFIFKKRINRFDLLCIFLGTPIYWYGFVHPSSTDLVSGIFPFIYFLLVKKCMNSSNSKDYFILGLSLGFGVILKVSLLFYGIIPLIFFIKYHKDYKDFFKRILPLLVIGYLIAITPFFVNEYLETGFSLYTYSSIVASYYLIYETVLAPAGYLIVSPLFFISLFSFFIFIKGESGIEDKILYSLFLIAPILKILVESFTYGGNAEYGARHLLTDVFVLMLLYPSFYLNGWKRSLARVFAFLCVVQSVFMSFVYMRDISGEYRWGIFYEKDLSAIFEQWPKYKYFFSNVWAGLTGEDFFGIFVFYPVILLASFLLMKLYSSRIETTAIYKNFIIYCCGVYSVIMLLNVWNNSRNVEQLKREGFYKDKVITNGTLMYSFSDNVGNILMHQRYSKLRGDEKYIEITEKALNEYKMNAVKEILIDPVGLKKKILKDDFSFIDF